MKCLKDLLSIILLNLSAMASAQDAPATNVRFSTLVPYHASVGTTAGLAIPGASVTGNVQGWRICNDGVPGASTYLAVGQATDPLTDGIRLGPGKCYLCLQCTAGLLKATRVVGQAAANTYSVLQFKP